MPELNLVVSPGKLPGTVLTAQGESLTVPSDWALLPPGDAGLTRRVKAAGPSWTVQVVKGRKKFSQGVWAPAKNIEHARATVEADRSTESYAKRREADANRRDREQNEYVEDFNAAVLEFLDFAPAYQALAQKMATAITAHATPVGSGTVARTQRIPIEKRAEAAVIAWMRHQTTSYDHMKIARVKGERREVRQELASISRKLLERYRRSVATDALSCPLQKALAAVPATPT